MRPSPEVHDALACLLSYPGCPSGPSGPEASGAGDRYPAAVDLISRSCPESAADLRSFTEAIRSFEAGELEELYTRTFDNVAERSLEVGWQIFGENYARGALMVRFRSLMREHGIVERTELPDHLTHVLPLLARVPESLARALAGNQVLQGVEKMLAGVQACESPWTGVLEATRKVLLMHGSSVQTPSEVMQ